MAALSRRLFRSSLLSNPKPTERHYHFSMSFCTTTDDSLSDSSDSDESNSPKSVPEQSSSSSSKNTSNRRPFIETTLENGLDVGVYKVEISEFLLCIIEGDLSFSFLGNFVFLCRRY